MVVCRCSGHFCVFHHELLYAVFNRELQLRESLCLLARLPFYAYYHMQGHCIEECTCGQSNIMANSARTAGLTIAFTVIECDKSFSISMENSRFIISLLRCWLLSLHSLLIWSAKSPAACRVFVAALIVQAILDVRKIEFTHDIDQVLGLLVHRLPTKSRS